MHRWGEWILGVTTKQGATMPGLTLQQDGNTLTGHYSSETLVEAEVTGTVESSQVIISSFADPGVGQEVPFIYERTVDGDGAGLRQSPASKYTGYQEPGTMRCAPGVPAPIIQAPPWLPVSGKPEFRSSAYGIAIVT